MIVHVFFFMNLFVFFSRPPEARCCPLAVPWRLAVARRPAEAYARAEPLRDAPGRPPIDERSGAFWQWPGSPGTPHSSSRTRTDAAWSRRRRLVGGLQSDTPSQRIKDARPLRTTRARNSRSSCWARGPRFSATPSLRRPARPLGSRAVDCRCHWFRTRAATTVSYHAATPTAHTRGARTAPR